MRRSLAAIALAAVAAVALTGCVSITAQTGVQQHVVGALRVTVQLCATDTQAPINHPGCPVASNTPYDAPDLTVSTQILVAFRTLASAEPPATITGTTNASGGEAVTFARSPTYEAELEALLPAGDGNAWAGYLSEPYSYEPGAVGSAAREMAVVADVALPQPAGGGPFVGPLPVRPVAGARLVGGPLAANRPVDCGESPFTDTDDTICVDAPHPTTAAVDVNFPVADFGIVAGKATASPGQAVALPFDVRGAGPLPAGLVANVTATTGLPGASAVPSAGSVALGNGSSTRVTVPIAIPPKAGPGDFPVVLTAALANGQVRSAAATLTVRDRQPPVISRLVVAPRRFRPRRRGPALAPRGRGARVRVDLSERARVAFRVQRCRRAPGRRRLRCRRVRRRPFAATLARGTARLRFTGSVGGRRLRPGRYRLVAIPRDGAGNRGRAARAPFAIRGRRAGRGRR